MSALQTHPFQQPENNILRLDVNSAAELLNGVAVMPSFLDLNPTPQNLTANGTNSTFIDPVEGGYFKDFKVGFRFTSSGWLTDANNGPVEVVEWIDNNTIRVRKLDGETVTTESGAGSRTLTGNDYRKKYRCMMFQDDVNLIFNDNPEAVFFLPAYEALYLHSSMIWFAVDVDTVIMWGD